MDRLILYNAAVKIFIGMVAVIIIVMALTSGDGDH